MKAKEGKLRICIFLLIAVNGLAAFLFYKYGISGFHVTILVFLTLLCIITATIRNKAFRINAIVLLSLLLVSEMCLRIAKKGFPNYIENNSTSIFCMYQSRSFGTSGRLIHGLYINRPNSKRTEKKVEFQYLHKYNEMGLRDTALFFYRNKKNILLLGDSYTEGVGAPVDSTGPRSVEYHLKEMGKNYAVINAGVSGSDIVYAFELLDTLFKQTQPKIVLYNLHYSDIDDIMFKGGDERFTNGTRKAFWWEYLYSFSCIYRIISNRILHLNPDATTKDDFNFALEVIKQKVVDFNEYCSKNKAIFVLIITPGPNELYNTYHFANAFNLEPTIKELDSPVNYINTQQILTDEINRSNDVDKYYHRLDFHLTAYGYWLWGKIVASGLRNIPD
jgi:lysophospholipase L1-like esterase